VLSEGVMVVWALLMTKIPRGLSGSVSMRCARGFYDGVSGLGNTKMEWVGIRMICLHGLG
jgi:hypothetical protein